MLLCGLGLHSHRAAVQAMAYQRRLPVGIKAFLGGASCSSHCLLLRVKQHRQVLAYPDRFSGVAEHCPRTIRNPPFAVGKLHGEQLAGKRHRSAIVVRVTHIQYLKRKMWLLVAKSRVPDVHRKAAFSGITGKVFFCPSPALGGGATRADPLMALAPVAAQGLHVASIEDREQTELSPAMAAGGHAGVISHDGSPSKRKDAAGGVRWATHRGLCSASPRQAPPPVR